MKEAKKNLTIKVRRNLNNDSTNAFMHALAKQLTNEVHQGRNSYKAFEIQTT